jgi:Tfp pilus assembly protein PilN
MKAVNLIPTDERGGSGITAGRSGGSVYVVLVLLGGLAACALLYGLSARQISSRKAQISSLTARARQAQARATLLAPYTSFIAMREQRVQAVSQLVDSRFDWAQAFHELGRVMPPNKVSLTSLDGTVGSTSSSTLAPPTGPKAAASAGAATTATVTSATPPGSVPVFTITGCATSQAEVALMLERLRLIAGVSEVKLQSSTKSGSAAAGGTGASGAGSSGCESGDPEFNAQVTFDALPSTPAASPSGSGTSVTASVSAGASAPAPGAVR